MTEQRLALVTGASRGRGGAIAVWFARAGWSFGYRRECARAWWRGHESAAVRERRQKGMDI